MRIHQQVHRIQKEFYVTPTVKRYVNIYLIEGQYCYLIDSGVAGTEQLIETYLQSINRQLTDVRGIFLTHSHPDHMGAAAAIKRVTNCKIYAPVEEVSWIENIQSQYKMRPIPNFYQLVPESVKVDYSLTDGEKVLLESDIQLTAISTKGHSHGSMSYCLNHSVLFMGDAIPVENDLPIFVDYKETLRSLQKIQSMSGIQYYCPAWDDVYRKEDFVRVVEKSKEMLIRLKNAVAEVTLQNSYGNVEDSKDGSLVSYEKLMAEILRRAELLQYAGNPLVVKSIEACNNICDKS